MWTHSKQRCHSLLNPACLTLHTNTLPFSLQVKPKLNSKGKGKMIAVPGGATPGGADEQGADEKGADDNDSDPADGTAPPLHEFYAAFRKKVDDLREDKADDKGKGKGKGASTKPGGAPEAVKEVDLQAMLAEAREQGKTQGAQSYMTCQIIRSCIHTFQHTQQEC